MLIDVDVDRFEGGYKIQFPIAQFKERTDLKMAIVIITCFANDMDLDPELEPDDLQEIIDKVSELSKTKFTVEIYEDGIEVDI